MTEGYGEVFIPLRPKLAVDTELPGDSGYKPGDSELEAFFHTGSLIRRLRSSGSGESGPISSVSGLGRKNTHVLLFDWYLCLTKVCLGSLEH